MRYIVDHDYHIHSYISLCSHDPEETPARILEYAKQNSLKKICLTDHYWDENVPGASGWYQKQNYAHVSEALPLPRAEGIEFVFGCETDMDKFFTVGISDKMLDKFGFIIIPTTHLHMSGFTIDAEKDGSPERRAELYVERLDKLLDMDLPFEKIGIAHLTCELIFSREKDDRRSFLEVIDNVSDDTFRELFTKLAKRGAGFELNFPIDWFEDGSEDAERQLRPYRIAMKCGCKFYLGSDAHTVRSLELGTKNFEHMVDALGLTEDMKFHF